MQENLINKEEIKILKKGKVIDYFVDGKRLRLQYQK